MSEIQSSRRNRIFLISIIVVVLGAAVAFLVESKNRDKGPRFDAVKVERGDLQQTILSTGVAQPENRLEIKPAIAGRVEQVLVTEGRRVRKGEILAWLSSTERAALLDAARSKGEEEYKRWAELYKAAPLLAPLSGVVILRGVEPGQTVTTGDVVFVLSDRLMIKAQVDETDIAEIKLGQHASIGLDAYPDHNIEGTVEHIAYDAKTVNNVTTYEVDVLPSEAPAFMKSGMTANVSFEVLSKKGVLTLPVDAIRTKDGRSLVKTPHDEGRGPAESKEVVTGLSDGKRIEIVSGLNEGDTVLVPRIELNLKHDNATSPFSPMNTRKKR